jgi:hypothetical protein
VRHHQIFAGGERIGRRQERQASRGELVAFPLVRAAVGNAVGVGIDQESADGIEIAGPFCRDNS